MAGGNTASSGADNWYGPLTRRLPHNLFRNFINPMLMGFGYGDRADKFRSGMGGGPLADYMKSVQGMSSTYIPQAQALGADIAARAPQLYGQLQGQISGALDKLPALQQAGQGGVDRAQWLVDQAFSPITSRALYGETMNRALGEARQGQAARGLMEQGTGQQMEQDLGRDIAYQFAMNDQANQGGSVDRLLGAIGNQVGLNQAGVPLAQMGMQGLGDYLQLQQAGMNLPIAAAGNLFSLLSGGLMPGLQLSQITGPQQTSDSKGWKAL